MLIRSLTRPRSRRSSERGPVPIVSQTSMSETRDRIRTYEVSRRVGEIMHYLWDPIGVARAPEARDEYDGYLPDVIAILSRGGNAEELAAYLTQVETQRMGLSDTSETHARNYEIAGLLGRHFTFVAHEFDKLG